MRILVSWLRDFVAVDQSIEELAHLLSMRGFEVASIEEPPPGPLAPPWSSEGQRSTAAATRAGPSTGAADTPDAVIDLEITANRPDCMSVVGIAREVATACRTPLRLPSLSTAEAAGTGVQVEVTIEDPDLCARYAAAPAEVRVGPSPPWMANRLIAAGVRPVNNIVDVTNYVLIELGHPMHAFDLERLEGRRIRVRRALPGERLKTLDGVVRTLDPDVLAIADARRAQAIGGVMGGADSEVHERTRLVVFESAWFAPVSVRRTSKRLGLKTEASVRFERGADIEAPRAALGRAVALVETLGAGRLAGPVIDQYPAPRWPARVRLDPREVTRHLGVEIEAPEAERTLGDLGFRVNRHADLWDVEVPSFRVDVARDVDLIEELARHYGYDRLPERFPPLEETPRPSDLRISVDRVVREILIAAGFNEAVTFAFIDRDHAAPFAPEAETVGLARPLSEKFAVLRPSLVPGLIESTSHNRRREQRDVRLFEIGRRFTASGGEQRAVAFVWTGMAWPEHWYTPRRPVDVFDLKGVIERLCEAFRIDPKFRRPDPAVPWLVVEDSAVVVDGDGRTLGVLGRVRPDVVEARDLPRADAVFAAEIDLERLDAAGPPGPVRVRPLPRFPSIVRDLSILVDRRLPAERVRATIMAAAPPTLERLREFDRYQGPGIPADKTSLSLRLTFRSSDRTLIDAEVDEAMAAIVGALEREHGAVRR